MSKRATNKVTLLLTFLFLLAGMKKFELGILMICDVVKAIFPGDKPIQTVRRERRTATRSVRAVGGWTMTASVVWLLSETFATLMHYENIGEFFKTIDFYRLIAGAIVFAIGALLFLASKWLKSKWNLK